LTRHTSGQTHAHADGLGGSLQKPGTCDITAHVDLTGVTKAAEREGLTVLARLDQTYFMMGVGLEAMMNAAQGFEPPALHRRLALKTLMLPGGLGSTHKVLVFGKNVGAPRLRCLAYRERLT
jgi:SAM-dependent MidA family methyltransferase